MDTNRLQKILHEIFEELGTKTPRQLNAELGIDLDKATDVSRARAMVTHIQPMINRRFPKQKPPIDLFVMRSDNPDVRVGDNDLIARVGPKDGVRVEIPIKLPRSVGIYFGIKRHQMDVGLLPKLSDGQRQLLAAAAAIKGEAPDLYLANLLDGILKEILQPYIVADDAVQKRYRDKLIGLGIYPDAIKAHWLSLN